MFQAVTSGLLERKPAGTEMKNLPPEILASVFQHILLGSASLIARCCSHWLAAISSHPVARALSSRLPRPMLVQWKALARTQGAWGALMSVHGLPAPGECIRLITQPR